MPDLKQLILARVSDDLVAIEGRVIHCTRGLEDAWIIGIAFDAMPASSRDVFHRYITAFESS